MVAPTVSASRRGPKVVGGLIGLGGGLLMAAGSYMPWLSRFGDSVSGWDLYDLRNDLDEFPFMIDEMFEPRFDPFFTGATTLVLGLVLAAVSVAVLLAGERPLPSRLRVGAGLYATAVMSALSAFMVVAVNAMSALSQPQGSDVTVELGFWAVAAGALAGAVGVLRASARSPAELRGVATAAALPASTAIAAPGWHDDPYHRHQLRYWDGQAWTSHVSDQGASSEDPLLVG